MEDFFSIDLKTFLPPFQYLPPFGVVKVVGKSATNHRKVVGKSVNCPQTNRRGQGECYGQGDFRVSIFYSHYEVFRKHSLVFIRRILNLTSVFRGRPSLLRDHHWHSNRLAAFQDGRPLHYAIRKDL